jgi:hypothetical protein
MRKQAPLNTGFYHFGTFVVPASTGDPWTSADQKCLVAAIKGHGQVTALCFRTDYYGVWFGYQVDDSPLVVAHNGHCLQNMGLIGSAADGMPCFLPYFNGPDDLSLACRVPLPFDRLFRLWMGNSHRTEAKRCIGLHVYVNGRGVEPVEGNLLDWNVVWKGGRHPLTRRSAETITLEKCRQR